MSAIKTKTNKNSKKLNPEITNPIEQGVTDMLYDETEKNAFAEYFSFVKAAFYAYFVDKNIL